MPNALERVRAVDPVEPGRWSETPEGRATRRRVFDVGVSPVARRRRALPVLLAAVLVLAIAASIVVLTRPGSHRESGRPESPSLDFRSGGWEQLDAGPVQEIEHPEVTWTGRALVVTPEPGAVHWSAAAFDPTAGAWRAVAVPPRTPTVRPVWTGRELIWWSDGIAYDPTNDTWRTLPNPMLVPFRSPAVVWTGSELVVIGGDSAKACADSMNADCVAGIGATAYSPGLGRWRRIAEPPVATLSDAASAIWDGRAVFVVDPLNGVLPQNFVGAYSPATDSWETLPTPGPQSAGGAPVVSEELVVTFALEGTDTRLVAHIFDPRTRGWSSVASHLAGSTCEPLSAAVPGGAAVACVGGIEYLDLGARTWESIPASPNQLGSLVWTGKELIGLSQDGEHLLRYRPGR